MRATPSTFVRPAQWHDHAVPHLRQGQPKTAGGPWAWPEKAVSPFGSSWWGLAGLKLANSERMKARRFDVAKAGSSTVKEERMIGILIAVLLAALVYWLCVALGLPAVVAIVAAILVLIAGFTTGGYGFGSRWGPPGGAAPRWGRRRGPPPPP